MGPPIYAAQNASKARIPFIPPRGSETTRISISFPPRKTHRIKLM